MSVLQKMAGLFVIAFAAVSFAMAAQAPQQSAEFTATAQQRGSEKPASTKMKMEAENSAPFAFVELFTSEGCSSCPSADRNLERIAADAKANGQNIYTLSYHVDYWDYLGWKDPYSSKEFTDRQRSYARQFESSRIYTPQMVVNGQAEFVGSNKKLSSRALDAALRAETNAAIKIDVGIKKNRAIKVTWQASGIDTGDVVRVALVQNEGTQNVNRGENARRKLSHVNIVRQLKADNQPGASGKVEFTAPRDFDKNNFHVVAFVQSSSGVKAASKSSDFAESQMAPSKKASMKSEMKKKASKAKRISVRKPSLKQFDPGLIDSDRFLEMLGGDSRILKANLASAHEQWDVSYVPMLLEVGRFLPQKQRALVIGLLEEKTGNRFGFDFDKWMQWNWKQKYDQHPQYAQFKSVLYRQIDPRFAEYFEETDSATIRLDEIRWGGVRRDGIPPLKNPKMLAAKDAGYLADTDVVFGIELNGDARAYPKRILAWHEMFKDTIGGQSVCGVY